MTYKVFKITNTKVEIIMCLTNGLVMYIMKLNILFCFQCKFQKNCIHSFLKKQIWIQTTLFIFDNLVNSIYLSVVFRCHIEWKNLYISQPKIMSKLDIKKYNLILIFQPINFISFYCVSFWVKYYNSSSDRSLIKYNITQCNDTPKWNTYKMKNKSHTRWIKY